jgi:hypothetical protein
MRPEGRTIPNGVLHDLQVFGHLNDFPDGSTERASPGRTQKFRGRIVAVHFGADPREFNKSGDEGACNAHLLLPLRDPWKPELALKRNWK